MSTFLKRFIVFLLVVAVGVFCYSFFNNGILNKPLSPKKTVSIAIDDLKLEVFYNRPSKRDRVIFGALVPFDQVWRTGANEATTFETNKSLMVDGNELPAGKYTLWTIPKDGHWDVMFNSKRYKWGVDETMQAMRDPDFDVVKIAVPVEKLQHAVEQFTIAFDNSTDNLSLTMAWDDTKVTVPLK